MKTILFPLVCCKPPSFGRAMGREVALSLSLSLPSSLQTKKRNDGQPSSCVRNGQAQTKKLCTLVCRKDGASIRCLPLVPEAPQLKMHKLQFVGIACLLPDIGIDQRSSGVAHVLVQVNTPAFKIFAEPESPNEGAGLTNVINWDRL